MKKELTPQEIKFNFDFKNETNEKGEIKELIGSYKKVGRALNIKKEGYNLYLIDSFSKDKLRQLTNYIKEQYKSLPAPKDICYVIVEDDKKPEPLFVENGKGKRLKEIVENIKEVYFDIIEEFYGSSTLDEKDKLVQDIQTRREDYIEELMVMAKDAGFEVKATNKGFAFIPLSDGEAMSEKEYDELTKESKSKIVGQASELKKKAEDVLEKLREIEVKSMKKLKDIYSKYLTSKMEETKDDALLEFINDDDAYEYLEKLFMNIEKDIVESYTMDLDDDEKVIYEAINKYAVQVIVDNSLNSYPVVIYEEDPTLNNLIGFLEYENHNGVYTTDISLINSGAMIKANEGCLILRVNSLATNAYSYYYLKKALLSNNVSIDTSRGYSEILSISGLKPKSIPINLKVILIGDYETYDALYNADEDFRKLFPLRAEFNSIVEMKDEAVTYIKNYIDEVTLNNNLLKVSEKALMEIVKYLSRKADSKEKMNIDDFRIDKLLTLANDLAKSKGNKVISKDDIIDIAYEVELVEEEYIKVYKEKKILISVEGRMVGAINGLAVLDTGYHSFGKPMRITCIAYKGNGSIIDIHKESHLSGRIHEKSINTLRGILNIMFNAYDTLPVDFNLSFEQTYGIVEGDSASVAEMICLLSALSKRGVKQNIAVTGSLNQFAQVQPIGGANEKIEGFYKVCKLINNVKNKGVLIPSSNADELNLIPEVEEAIERGDFHIYVMDTLEDAIETLLLEENETIEEFYELIQNEIKKYKKIKKEKPANEVKDIEENDEIKEEKDIKEDSESEKAD